MRPGLRRRLERRHDVDVDVAIVVFSAVLVALVWAMFIIEGASESDEAAATAVKQNSNLAVAYEEHVSRTLKGLDAVIRFTRHEYARLGPELDIPRYLAEGVIDGQLFTILSVVDERGELILSSNPQAAANYADREFFRFHAGHEADRLYISKPVFGRVSRTWQIPITRRITRADGGFGGLVVLSVDPAYLTGFYQKAELGGHGLVMLVGLDGVARARRVGRVVSFGNDLSGSMLIERHLASRAGSYVDTGGVEDVVRYVSYRTLDEYPLIVAVGTAQDEVLAEVNANRRRDYLTAALVTVAILLLCALVLAATARQRRASRALEASETRFRATFEQAAIGIAHVSLDGRYIAVNAKFCDMLGQTREALMAAPGAQWTQDVPVEALLAGRLDAYAVERRFPGGGKEAWGNSTVTVVRGADGEPMHFLQVVEDTTERKRLEMSLVEAATTDMLTGLPNRRHFVGRMEEEHARLRRFDMHQAALLLLDLDRFKRINDTYGHAAGDAVLRHFAETLRNGIRRIDVVGRVGGEEFAIILPGAARGDAIEFAERLRARVAATPASYEGAPVAYTVSIGVAPMDPADAQAGAALVRADAALYRAKAGGRNRVEAAA